MGLKMSSMNYDAIRAEKSARQANYASRAISAAKGQASHYSLSPNSPSARKQSVKLVMPSFSF